MIHKFETIMNVKIVESAIDIIITLSMIYIASAEKHHLLFQR